MANFRITPDGHGFILSGELDMEHADEFVAAFRDALPVGGPVSVDMRELAFMDSSGIQAIVGAAVAAPAVCIILHGVHDEVQKVVQLTGIGESLANLHVMPCAVGVG
jgi:anti-anti-sigma factor